LREVKEALKRLERKQEKQRSEGDDWKTEVRDGYRVWKCANCRARLAGGRFKPSVICPKCGKYQWVPGEWSLKRWE